MFPSAALLGACKDTARRGVWVWLTNSSFIINYHMMMMTMTMMTINNDAIAIPLQ